MLTASLCLCIACSKRLGMYVVSTNAAPMDYVMHTAHVLEFKFQSRERLRNLV